MTDMEEIELLAKACFDRQEWERRKDMPNTRTDAWDDIHETAKQYWREFAGPMLPFLRAAELRGRVTGMREAAEACHGGAMFLDTAMCADESKLLALYAKRLFNLADKLSPTT